MVVNDSVYVYDKQANGIIKSIETMKGFKGYPYKLYHVLVDTAIKTYFEYQITDRDIVIKAKETK